MAIYSAISSDRTEYFKLIEWRVESFLESVVKYKINSTKTFSGRVKLYRVLSVYFLSTFAENSA